MPNLETAFLNKTFSNPTVLSSGILGVYGSSLVRVAIEGAGAVTSKSISLNYRSGHPNPIIVEFEAGLINAVGLSTHGIDDSISEISYAVKNSPSPVIASVFADNVENFALVSQRINEANPDFIEVNISCPNVESEFGKPFATDPKTSAAVTSAVKKVSKAPVIVKLSPNVPNIKLIAKSVVDAGADAICAINTVGPGMVIDIESAKPILSNKVGGVSGPAIKPVAVRCVYDIFSEVDVPIIGVGGVTNGSDAIEMIFAGATAVGIGSAVHYRGIGVFKKVSKEIFRFMDTHDYSSIEEMRGLAHE
ncbi:MAG: dihydroorotate dehydrogenase [Candidatus Diapherotrites archaeon]|nr:dihydroorotate dehydrogenase [Candidatus Diapherotrites archaeon]